MGILDNRCAIVTGAGRGIGLGIARALGAAGAQIVVAEIDREAGESATEALVESGVDARYQHCDVGEVSSIQRCVDETIAHHDRIDILVNNAVFNAPQTPLLDHDDDLWDALVRVALRGTERFMRACHPHLRVNGGRIVNLGSAAGYQGMAGFAAYAAVKEGIRALSKVAAREWGADGITVNVIAPFADSDGWRRFIKAQPQAAEQMLEGRPVPRVGDCESDVGAAVVFLSSDAASYLTGVTLPVDGGGAFLA
ncbi:SDR family oxidoreductase [Myxococcota bacterium]|nr:SDR family oxidoreductase [Myxococcota bacterium]